MGRAKRRYLDFIKAKRKLNILKNTRSFSDVLLHKLSKGKVHCSCPMCSSKTNTSLNKSRGAVDNFRGNRLATTNNRYKKNYKASDRRKIDRMDYKEIL